MFRFSPTLSLFSLHLGHSHGCSLLASVSFCVNSPVLEPQYGAAVDRRLSGLSRFRVREDGRVVGRLVTTLRARPSNINVPEGERREEEQGRQKASLAVLRHDCSSQTQESEAELYSLMPRFRSALSH